METAFNLSNKYFIRTTTMYYTGELVGIYSTELVLKNAAWIANTGYFTQALATGKFDEVEVYPSDAYVIINRAQIVDASEFNHPLPRERK